MINKKKYSFAALKFLIILWIAPCLGNRLIVKFEQPPIKAFQAAQKDFATSNPKKKLPKNLKKRPSPSGIQVTRAGFRKFTDTTGIVSFPQSIEDKKDKVLTITVFVTTKVFPRILSGNTVDHFALWQESKPSKLNAAVFSMERKKTDENLWSWTVTESTLPDNGKIPNTAVVIQADPSSIFIPTGSSTSSKQKQHCFLPTIYILDRVDLDKTVIENLGNTTINPDKAAQEAPFNLLENLKSQIKAGTDPNKKVEIKNLSESSI